MRKLEKRYAFEYLLYANSSHKLKNYSSMLELGLSNVIADLSKLQRCVLQVFPAPLVKCFKIQVLASFYNSNVSVSDWDILAPDCVDRVLHHYFLYIGVLVEFIVLDGVLVVPLYHQPQVPGLVVWSGYFRSILRGLLLLFQGFPGRGRLGGLGELRLGFLLDWGWGRFLERFLTVLFVV